jgi:hypothetical protein
MKPQREQAMPKAPLFTPTRQQIIDVFRNSMAYEIMFTFGVPDHDPTDYCQWETINFTRLAHARVLYPFLETSADDRWKTDVVSEDFGYPSQSIPLPVEDRPRVNKDLLHLTYDRLRHTPKTKAWPDSILACLWQPVVGFMDHVKNQADLFTSEDDSKSWVQLLGLMKSGRELRIRCDVDANNRGVYQMTCGDLLPGGLPRLTQHLRRLTA